MFLCRPATADFLCAKQIFIGEDRTATMDYAGNIIICESDYGFVRRIRFLRLTP
jgi:hypothetical protein